MRHRLALTRVNRFAGIAIVPMMVLAIVVFSRFAGPRLESAPPPAAGLIVVANLRSQTLTFHDFTDGKERQLALAGPPHEMVLEGGRLYVTLGRAGELVEIDPAGPAVLRTLHLDGEPHGLAVYGGNLVVTLDKAAQAVVIDRATLTELRRFPTGNTPHVVAVSSEALLVTDSRDNQLRELLPDPATVATGPQPEGLALVGPYAVTADALGGSLTVVATEGLETRAIISTGGSPVRVIGFENEVLAAVQGKEQLVLADPAKLRVTVRRAVDPRPDGLCLSSDQRHLAVASNASGRVQFFATEGWRPAGAIQLSDGIGACLWLR